MWWRLHRFKWCLVFTLTPKSIPTCQRLHLPHLSAHWKLCQHLLHQHGCKLPRTLLNWTRLHRDEGWQFRGLSTDGKILWRWQQCPCFPANHPKPLDDQVKEGNMLDCPRDCLIIICFTGSHPTSGTVDLDLRFNMNPLMCLNQRTTNLANVVAPSSPPMVS